MLAAIEWQSKTPQWLKDGGDLIPHPATWINNRRWEDEQQTGPRSTPVTPAPGEAARKSQEIVEKVNQPAGYLPALAKRRAEQDAAFAADAGSAT